MGANNPVLNGLFRGIQLASTIQNMRTRQAQQQSLDKYRQALDLHRAQTEARQAQEDERRASERSIERQLKLRSLGAVPLDVGQTEQYRRGEDFSVELAPGLATTASSSVLDLKPVGEGAYAIPGPVESNALELMQALSRLDQEEAIRAKHRKPTSEPLPYKVTDDEGNVNYLDPRTPKLIGVAKGVGKKGGAEKPETAAERRARLNFERSIANETKGNKITSWANRILDENGDVQAALEDVERQSEYNPFVKDNRIAITAEIKKARQTTPLDQTNNVLLEMLTQDMGEQEKAAFAERMGFTTPAASGGSKRGERKSGASAEARSYLKRFRSNKQ